MIHAKQKSNLDLDESRWHIALTILPKKLNIKSRKSNENENKTKKNEKNNNNNNRNEQVDYRTTTETTETTNKKERVVVVQYTNKLFSAGIDFENH